MAYSETNLDLTFRCHKISGGKAEGEILISSSTICFYLAEPETELLATPLKPMPKIIASKNKYLDIRLSKLCPNR